MSYTYGVLHRISELYGFLNLKSRYSSVSGTTVRAIFENVTIGCEHLSSLLRTLLGFYSGD